MINCLPQLLFVCCIGLGQLLVVNASFANELNKEGIKLYNQESFALAIAKYQQAIDHGVLERISASRLASMRYNKARAYFRNSQFQAAIDLIDEILADFPTHFKALYLRARCLRQFKDESRLQQALDLYQVLKPEAPSDLHLEIEDSIADIQARLDEFHTRTSSSSLSGFFNIFSSPSISELSRTAAGLYDEGKCAEAIVQYDKAIVKAKKDRLSTTKINQLRYGKAQAFQCNENLIEAIRELDRILQTDPSNYAAHSLKQAYQRQHRPKPATKQTPKYVQLSEQATAKYNQKRYANAVALYSQAIKFAKRDHAQTSTLNIMLYNKARALNELGQYEKSIEELDVLLTQTPSHTRAQFRKAQALEKLDTASSLTKALGLLDGLNLKINLDERLDRKEIQESIERIRLRLLRLTKSTWDLKAQLRKMYASQRYHRAIELYDEAIAQAQRERLTRLEISEIRLEKARALHHLGRYADALKVLSQILRLDSSNYDAAYLRAKCLKNLGDQYSLSKALLILKQLAVEARDEDKVDIRTMKKDVEIKLRSKQDGWFWNWF